MGRLSASLLVFLLATAAAVALASCGGGNSGLLPGATASEINSNLDKVQELVAEGDCAGAEEASGEVKGQIESLDGVNAELKQALSEGATHLAQVVSTCEELPNEEDEAIEAQEAEEEARAEEEAEEKNQKKEKKEKPAKPKEEKEQEKEPVEPPEEEEKEEEVTPPEEEGSGTGSGGVGPATPAGGK